MKINKRILIGLFFVLIGVLLGLVRFNIINKDIFFDGWWTLFIIIPCFAGLFTSEDKMGNFIGLTIGVILLLTFQDVLTWNIVGKLFFPIILVLIGINLIFQDKIKERAIKIAKEKVGEQVKDDSITAVFSDRKLKLTKEKNHLSLTAVFGDVEIDATETEEELLAVDATSIFGEITLYVPADAEVQLNGTPIFGEMIDKRKPTELKNKKNKKVLVTATAVFGTIEVR